MLAIIGYVAFLAVGLALMVVGVLGIEHHLGLLAAMAAICVAVYFRFVLPITIGTYFGAVDVLGWPWWAGVLMAFPQLAVLLPAVLSGAFAAMGERASSLLRKD